MVAITTVLRFTKSQELRRFPVFPALLAVSLMTGRVFANDWPEVLTIAVAETEECFFDGEYDLAIRHLDQAEIWLKRPLNQDSLMKNGEDHGLVKAILSGLKAQILSEKGEAKRAESAIVSANTSLMNRRTFIARQGNILPDLWKYEAFLLFLEGDLHRSSPDFGLADNLSIPEALRVRFRKQSNPKRSLAAYNKASDVLTRSPAALRPDLLLQRLKGRLLVGLAHGLLYKTGVPSADDCRDASNYLDRAEDICKSNPFWATFLAPDSILPVSYKELENRGLTLDEKIALKRNFYQAIGDWLSMKLMRAEISAGGELAGLENHRNAKSAEQGYAETLGFCRAHFPPSHPTLQRVMLSQARWFTYLDCFLEKAGGVPKLQERLSLLQDCIFDVTRIRMTKGIDMRTQANCDTLELNALTRLLDIDAGADALSKDRKEKVRKRKQLLEVRIERRDQNSIEGKAHTEPGIANAEDRPALVELYVRTDFDDYDKPAQNRDPVGFWENQRVFQKRGIVIEDKDYIVRERYWVLDETATGLVKEAIPLKDGARTRVVFANTNGWQERGFEKRGKVVTERKSTMKVRSNYRGDADVETDEVSYSYRIEGVWVDPSTAGILSYDDNGKPVIEYPSTIIGLVRPQIGDTVIRSLDWCNGFADGGPSPFGLLALLPSACAGEVVAPRDEDGYVAVRWQNTGRKTSYRFDSHGFYDVNLAKNKENQASGGDLPP